jgi:hypothetical protein
MVATVKGFGLNITDVGAALALRRQQHPRRVSQATSCACRCMALAKPVQGGAGALKRSGCRPTPSRRTCRRAASSSPWRTSSRTCTRRASVQQAAGPDHHRRFRPEGRRRPEYPRRADGPPGVEIPGAGEGREGTSGSRGRTRRRRSLSRSSSLEASFDALMIGIGEKIIPPLQSFIHILAAHKRATIDVTVATAGLLAGTIALAAALKVGRLSGRISAVSPRTSTSSTARKTR